MSLNIGIGIRIGGRRAGGGGAPDGSPTNLVLTVLSDISIKLDWTIGSTNHDGHRIYISTNGVNFTEEDTVLGVVATYTATGLTKGQGYYFYVVAYKSSAEGDPTDTENISWSHWMQYDYTDNINTHTTWTTIQKALILGRLQESYVVQTFGPAGTNKTECDFFLFLQVNSNKLLHVSKTNTKTGATLRWNYGDGNIYEQNNVPAQTSTNEVTITSTDGFGAVTRFDISSNGWIGNVPNIPYYMPNNKYLSLLGSSASGWRLNGDLSAWNFHNDTTYINLAVNYFTGDLVNMYVPDKCWGFYIYSNLFTGTSPYVKATFSATSFIYHAYSNLFTISGGSNYKNRMDSYRIENNYLSSSEITAMIGRMEDYYAAVAPTYNTELIITGVYNGTIVGGDANTDLVALKGYYTDESKTLNITYNPDTYLLTPLDKPTLIITTDDDIITDYTKVLPVLSSRSKIATSYRYNSWIEGHQTITEVNALIAAGWSIEAHPNFNGKTENEVAIRAEMDSFVTFFTTNSIPAFNHCSYSGGIYSDLVKTVMADYVDTARDIGAFTGIANTTNRGYLIYKDNDKYALKSNTCDSIDAALVVAAKARLDKAKIKSAGVIIYMHSVTDDDIALIMEIVDYAIAEGFDVTNIPGLYTKMTT